MTRATFWTEVTLGAEVMSVLQLPPGRSKETKETSLPLQGGFFQIIEVWHPRTGSPGEPDAVLPNFTGHLVWVRSRGMPGGLYLTRQRVVVRLTTLGVRSDAAHWNGPCFGHAWGRCFGWRVGEWLEAHFRGAIWRRRRQRGLARSYRGWGGRGQVQQLTQRPKRLVLKINKKWGHEDSHLWEMTSLWSSRNPQNHKQRILQEFKNHHRNL